MHFGGWYGWGFGFGADEAGVPEEDLRMLLLSLLEDGPRHGYEILLELEERSDGQLEADAELVYPLLQSLVDQGLASVTMDDDEKLRFGLTDEGRGELDRRSEAIGRLWEQARRNEAWAWAGAGSGHGGPSSGRWDRCVPEDVEQVVGAAVGSACLSVRDALRQVDRALDRVVDDLFSGGTPRRGRRRDGGDDGTREGTL